MKPLIIVDTDVLIEIFDRKSEKGKHALELLEQSGEDIAITSLSLHEILYGHYKRNKKIRDIEAIHTLEFNNEDAKLSANIEVEAERKGRMIPQLDAMIAAIAINRNAKLFTFNTKHFKIIKKLNLFDK